jgi:hypothetical protein
MSNAPDHTAIDADRDPITAAAVIVLVGMLSALERGEAIATECHAVDSEGEWSLQLKLAEVLPAFEAAPPPAVKHCPLCKHPGFEHSCRHCDYIDD